MNFVFDSLKRATAERIKNASSSVNRRISGGKRPSWVSFGRTSGSESVYSWSASTDEGDVQMGHAV